MEQYEKTKQIIIGVCNMYSIYLRLQGAPEEN